ncbi:MAG: AmmeMemoRadiSam system protein A [archaeon]
MDALDRRDGEIAVAYARVVIERYLEDGEMPDPPETVDTSSLEDHRGAFVTLESGGLLRGCIGRPYPRQPVFEAIRESAIGAATNDPRFDPVDRDEFHDVTLEVSVLTEPEAVTVPDGDETLPIEVGRDGLIVENGVRSGLLLPQIPVEHGWDVETFLSQTCRKAGLSGQCWRDESVTVERFSAAVFHETDPNGSVEPVAVTESAMA